MHRCADAALPQRHDGKCCAVKVYADRAGRAMNQVLGDVLVLGWLLVWIWAGKQLHDVIARLALPGEKAEAAGRHLEGSLNDAAKNVGDLPLAGDKLRKPLDEGAASGREFAEAAQSYQDAVADLAVLAGVLVAVAPIVLLLAVWLPRRIAWITAASATSRLLRDDAGAADLLALRALAARPLHELARSSRATTDLMDAWRARDADVVGQLARLELDSLGVRARTRPRR